MDALLDGTICHVVTTGTELERFCTKGQRLVLLAFHDDLTAFVYPLTTSHRQKSIKVEREGTAAGWLIVDRGLFRLPIAGISATADRWMKFGTIRERVRSDLAVLEEKAVLDAANPLTFRGMDALEELRAKLPVVRPEKAKPTIKAPTDEELFQQYLDRLGPDKGKKF